MFKIRYKRDGNNIYAFFNTRISYGNHEYNWYWKLVEHFQRTFPSIRNEVINKYVAKYMSEDKNYYGTAKCHPDDVFNEYKGEQLARHRLIMKYLRDVDRISFDIRNHIRKETAYSSKGKCNFDE